MYFKDFLCSDTTGWSPDFHPDISSLSCDDWTAYYDQLPGNYICLNGQWTDFTVTDYLGRPGHTNQWCGEYFGEWKCDKLWNYPALNCCVCGKDTDYCTGNFEMIGSFPKTNIGATYVGHSTQVLCPSLGGQHQQNYINVDCKRDNNAGINYYEVRDGESCPVCKDTEDWNMGMVGTMDLTWVTCDLLGQEWAAPIGWICDPY